MILAKFFVKIANLNEANFLLQLLQFLTDLDPIPRITPDDSISQRFSGIFIPDNCCFSLIRDSDSNNPTDVNTFII